jgi:hypothetical protein
MEEDIFITYDGTKHTQIRNRLKNAVDIAQERLEYEAAHNTELLKGLSIVREFIKRNKRVCYGGTAMNMILPAEKRFYNPELDLPDYDFFTPDIDGDIERLVADLNKEGFKNVYHKIGIHEGTSKILVNFTPIADITRLASPIYTILQKRAFIREKIYYTDPDILRMMMYLELSRPRGMVSRWEKVYDRLQLINSNFPPRAMPPKRSPTRKRIQLAPPEIRRIVLNYCIESGRVLFTGGNLESFYRRVIEGRRDIFDLQKISSTIGILSSDVRQDAEAIKTLIGKDTDVFFQAAKGEFVPEYAEVRYKNLPVILLLQEVACNSFFTFNTQDGQHINIASLDTLITIWYGIAIFTTNMRQRIPNIESTIPKFIELVERNRQASRPRLPPFALNCQGYQKGYPTLLREKAERKKKLEL